MRNYYTLLLMALALTLFSSCTETDHPNRSENSDLYSFSDEGFSNDNSFSDSYSNKVSKGKSTFGNNYNIEIQVEDRDDFGSINKKSMDFNPKRENAYISDEDGNIKHVELKWTGRSTLEAIDEEGNKYNLKLK